MEKEITKWNYSDFRDKYNEIDKKFVKLQKEKEALENRITQRAIEICINCPNVPLDAEAMFPDKFRNEGRLRREFINEINSLTTSDLNSNGNDIDITIRTLSTEGRLGLIHHIEKYIISTEYGKQIKLKF